MKTPVSVTALLPVTVYVLRHGDGDCTNDGVTSKRDSFVLYPDYETYKTAKDGNQYVNPENSLLLFPKGDYMTAVPVCVVEEGKWPMFGGNFVYTSDGRFRNYCDYPIPVHDRFE